LGGDILQGEPELLPLQKFGSREDEQNPGVINFGFFLPGVSAEKGNRLWVRVIHEKDQFLQAIQPKDFELAHSVDPEYGDYWAATIKIRPEERPASGSAWGSPGKYVYRYCLKNPDIREPIDWVIDPFAREFGVGKLSSFTLGYKEQYEWKWSQYETVWKTPPLEDIILYELMISEFASDIDGTVSRLDYLADLGINCIELMPLSNVEKRVDWGFTPIGYFGVDDCFGNRKDLQKLVDAAHRKNIAVIVDSVYAHTSHLFPYHYVYDKLGWPEAENPFMGPFAENAFGISTDFNRKFTRDFFLTVNHHWLDCYHVDGFRYDYVPGYWLEGSENGYTKLVKDTYRLVKAKHDAGSHWQRFFRGDSVNLIQCAEQLQKPIDILNSTYSNCTWQNGTLHAARGAGSNPEGLSSLGLLFGLFGYPAEVSHNGERVTKTALQYLENHDHSRFVCKFGTVLPGNETNELLKEGNRALWYKVQPYLIGMFTARGIPMLWQGQEFGENYYLPEEGWGRVLLYRPVRWDYFYTPEGKSTISLVRKMVKLRRDNPQFSRGEHFFYNDLLYLSRKVILFSRKYGNLFSLIALNFGDLDQTVPFTFSHEGSYREELHGQENLTEVSAGEEVQLFVPSNYGRIWTLES